MCLENAAEVSFKQSETRRRWAISLVSSFASLVASNGVMVCRNGETCAETSVRFGALEQLTSDAPLRTGKCPRVDYHHNAHASHVNEQALLVAKS